MIGQRSKSTELNDRFRLCFENGIKAEKRLAMLLREKYGGRIIPSSREADMHDHIDFTWVQDNGIAVTFDVKSHKKNKDMLIDTEWVEQKNINGGDGWLYGKADYIAYEREGFWLVIARKELIMITEEFVRHKCPTTSNMDICAPYTRKGRKDVVVRIPFSEIIIRGKILWKETDMTDLYKLKISYDTL